MRRCAGCSQQARFLSQQEFLCGECVKVREAAGAECKALCMLCEDASALFFCRNDNANLCAKCDAEMHHSNPLAARNERVPLAYGACATGTPAYEGMDRAEYSLPCEAVTADSLLPLIKNEPLDDFSVPLLVAGSPNDSGSTLTVAQFSPLDVEQQQQAPQPYAQQAVVKGEKEIDPFLEWDGALLDFGLELDAFEHEIMSNSLAADAVVPIVEPAESSGCSGASGVVLPDGLVKAESCDGSAPCFMGLPYAHHVPAMVPGTMAPPPPQAAYPMMAGAWAQHAVPQYAMQLSVQNPQLMAAPGWTAAYGAAFYGAYPYPGDQTTREARHQSIKRYREKRNKRIFEKTIRYQSRKAYAEIRPRIKGRFAKREEKSVGQDAADEDANDRMVPECVRA